MVNSIVPRQDAVRTTVLPARAAYLIQAGDRSAFRMATAEATSHWGGATEPIIPVRKSGEVDALFKAVLTAAKVDNLVNVNVGDAVAKVFATTCSLPLTTLRRTYRPSPFAVTNSPLSLIEEDAASTLSARPTACASAPLWHATAIGSISIKGIAELDSVGLAHVETREPIEILGMQLRSSSMLDLTTAEFQENTIRNGMRPPPIFWVSKPNSLPDSLVYWNLRALRSLRFDHSIMAIVEPAILEDPDAIGEIRHSLANNLECTVPDMVLASYSVREDQLHNLATNMGLVRSESSRLSATPSYSSSWNPPKEPFTYMAGVDVGSLFLFERTYGKCTDDIVHVYAEEVQVRCKSPLGRANVTGLLRVSGPLLRDYPRRTEVARAIHTDSQWVDDQLQLAVSVGPDIYYKLRLPSAADVSWIILRSVSGAARLSDKGKLASRLEGSGLISALSLHPEVFGVIQALTTPRSQHVAKAIDRVRLAASDADPESLEIDRSMIGRAERRYSSIHQMRSAGGDASVDAAEALVSRSCAERGLEIDCSECTLTSFIPFRAATDDPICPACAASQRYTRRADGDLELYYRLNALVDRASDQGVIPHLIGMAFLRQMSPKAFVLPGIEILHESRVEAEIDLFGVDGDAVIYGEAKTSAKQFDEEQILKDFKKSKRVGATRHLLVAPDSLSQGAMELVKSAQHEFLVPDVFVCHGGVVDHL